MKSFGLAKDVWSLGELLIDQNDDLEKYGSRGTSVFIDLVLLHPTYTFTHTHTPSVLVSLTPPRHPFPPFQPDSFLQPLAIRNCKKLSLTLTESRGPLLLLILLVAARVCGRRADSFYANTRTLPASFFQQMHRK